MLTPEEKKKLLSLETTLKILSDDLKKFRIATAGPEAGETIRRPKKKDAAKQMIEKNLDRRNKRRVLKMIKNSK